MAEVSPRQRLAGLHVPLYLIHGAGDSVIPPSETKWLERDAPPAWVRNVVISDAIGHVELQQRLSLREQWSLLHFVAQLLEEADAEPKVSGEPRRSSGGLRTDG